MSEPTIDEMLEWIGGVFNSTRSYDRDRAMREAVRAILEQVRASEYMTGTIAEWLVVKRGLELEAIRAFVERVEKRRNCVD